MIITAEQPSASHDTPNCRCSTSLDLARDHGVASGRLSDWGIGKLKADWHAREAERYRIAAEVVDAEERGAAPRRRQPTTSVG
jgi:hypothetical protein